MDQEQMSIPRAEVGRCFSFDNRDNGYARGEEFAAIILERLSDVIKDGEIIRAIIRNSGVNQDGSLRGTRSGEVFIEARDTNKLLIIGSVQPNFGNLEGASGLTGLIKTALILEHGIVSPNADFEKVNPKIDTKFLKVQVPREDMICSTNGIRKVSINFFGLEGTNTHTILDDAFQYLDSQNLTGNHDTVPLKSELEPMKPMPSEKADKIKPKSRLR
ncbi:thiolase-like protein [Calycina marina]|uniref:Thiolase-like protein n=1 Tax=Calycina marina TaxID=1763456 RepID=A0A9P8CCA6_9HELO|nr:thiolase-like protein [Calycina marina]